MGMGRVAAWTNLAYRFAAHVLLRMPARVFRRGGDARRFRDAVLPEGYVPLDAADREMMPRAMSCIDCGLCALACPAIEMAPAAAWDEAWTFVAGPSRSLDRAPLVAAGPLECASCDACAAVCPTGVPITEIASMLTRLARPTLHTALAAALITLTFAAPLMAQDDDRPRAREAGVIIGVFGTGEHNAITDVPGVRVGHATVRGQNGHTGVTAILPPGTDWFHSRVPAAVVTGNGFGKLVGVTQLRELGELETPVLLTCTLCVWRAADAMADWLLAQPGMGAVRSINPVVGETNDGSLNDIRSRPIAPADVVRALEDATDGAVEEGSTGAGAGTVAFGWKGGIGTASRVLPQSYGGYTVGVLVQSNFGGILTIGGAPVGRELGRYSFQRETGGDASADEPTPDGSIMIVVATDAPLGSRNLERLAQRSLIGLGRTGASMSNGSGDYVIAFSTAESVRRTGGGNVQPTERLANDAMSPLFQAVAEATEEAILNSLFRAQPATWGDRTVEALPLGATLEVLRRYRVIE